MALTPNQEASITHLTGPLLISAGAGSGKTFTLTQRIARALTPGSGKGDTPFLQDIEEVLAITFTEKAAQEIKARVRSTLRQQGLISQALKVDSAWISTIHGACSRILREQALNLGIDPGFRLLSEQEQSNLRALCIEEVLGSENELLEDKRFSGLLQVFGARSRDNSVQAMLTQVLTTASGLMDGLSSFSFGPEPLSPSRLVLKLFEAYQSLGAQLEAELSNTKKPGKTLVEAQTWISEGLETLQAFLDQAPSYEDLLAWLEESSDLSKRAGSDAYKEGVEELRHLRMNVAGECCSARVWPYACELLELATLVEEHYHKHLNEQGALDMDALLRETLCAFRDHPDIAAAYADRFKLVMVDEFQDTNQLQIDLISYLVGEGEERLCTVGDTQQSIYAFRGADVNVYEAHKQHMRENPCALDVKLDVNFRSHAAILDFTARVFSQEEVFGDTFLNLEAGRDEARVKVPYQGRAPRIDIVGIEGERGVGADVRSCLAAEEIAQRFAALRSEGHRARDMVILLGSMSRSVIYANILRKHGFDCVITGGSTFASFVEVHTIAALLNVLANPADTQSLFSVLTSNLFGCSADDLVDLSTKYDEEGLPRRRSLVEGLYAIDLDTAAPEVKSAVEIFERAGRLLGTKTPSAIVSQVLFECGIFLRLDEEGASGKAQVANILKALRLIEDFEDGGAGMARVAFLFNEFVEECGKEKPGALTTGERNYVQIMTVHASKGLEFPIVALGECWKVSANETSGALLMKQVGSQVNCSLFTSPQEERIKKLLKLASPHVVADPHKALHSAISSFEYRTILKQLIAYEALAECRRRLYVAFTRAAEALIVTFTDFKAPLVQDMALALCGEESFPPQDADFSYQGKESARYHYRFIGADEAVDFQENTAAAKCAPTSFILPQFQTPQTPDQLSWQPDRAGLWSYSSLHDALEKSGIIKCIQEDYGELTSDVSVTDVVALPPSEVDFFDEEVSWDEIATNLVRDADRATQFGSAFHLCAQYAVMHRHGQEALALPDEERMRAIAVSCQMPSDWLVRLKTALQRWFASDLACRVASYSKLSAEVPFCIKVLDDINAAEPFYLEGEIDLLCVSDSEDVASEKALVIDYKTGGHPGEGLDQLLDKHRLQAECYAFALLSRGYAEVELCFVRVEQENADGQPQVVSYVFKQENREQLVRKLTSLQRQVVRQV